MKINHGMHHRKIKNSNEAVAGIIVAVLLLGLFFTMYAVVQGVYVPQWMENKEAEHMDQVANQFAELKSSVDVLTVQQQLYSTITNPITLGSRELPYFVTARANGELTIIENEDYKIDINGIKGSVEYDLTSIRYHAYNAYFVEQTYILEGGGIIRDQPTGTSTMIVYPSATIAQVDGDSLLNISFYLPVIAGKEEKITRYGCGNCFIRTNYSHFNEYTDDISSGYLRIYSDYAEAWFDALNRTMSDLVSVTLISTESPPYVEISQMVGGDPVELYIKRLFIEAQIGPGWT